MMTSTTAGAIGWVPRKSLSIEILIMPSLVSKRAENNRSCRFGSKPEVCRSPRSIAIRPSMRSSASSLNSAALTKDSFSASRRQTT